MRSTITASDDPPVLPARLPVLSRAQVLRRIVAVTAVFVWSIARRVGDVLGLRWLAFALTGRLAKHRPLSGPVAMRGAFERLGPTYVKLGQLIASGEALFPERYSEEFRALLDRVPPFGFDAVEATLRAELGSASSALLAHLERTPIAAASIAQVHAARLADGREIVVKVQRPGIASLAAADVAIMRWCARLASRLSSYARRANLVAVIEDFEANLVAELDFRNEAARMREFNDVMRTMGNDSVAAPQVHDALSTARVLTMERFHGVRLDDLEALRALPYDIEERLLTGIRAWFQTLIVRGFFHGDVHAGNFMQLLDGRVGYLDFGIVGTLDPEQKKNVLAYVIAFQQRDFDQVARAMISMDTVDDPSAVDVPALGAALAVAYAPLLDPDEHFKMRQLLPSVIRVARAHSLRMPRDLVLLTKQLVYLDRYTRAIAGPKMNVLTDRRLTSMILQDMFAAAL